MFKSIINLLFDLIKKSSLCIFTQIVFSSKFIYNILRILSFVYFNVLNICSIIKLNFKNILWFWLPFIHISSLILLGKGRFWIKKSFIFWFSWIISSLSLVLISTIWIWEISWGLLEVLFTLRNWISYWSLGTKRSLETIVIWLSLIYITGILSNTNRGNRLSLGI